MRSILGILFVLIFNVSIASAISTDEKCLICREVVSAMHGYTATGPSRRQFLNKFNHVCRRYPHYKRICLSNLKVHEKFLYVELFKDIIRPLQVCFMLEECDLYSYLTNFDLATYML